MSPDGQIVEAIAKYFVQKFKMKTRYLFGLLIVATLSACSESAEIYTTDDGIAINGYDAVAYFTDKTHTVGKPEFEYSWKGAMWRFSNRKHLDDFRSNPDMYAPQYGGYCAFGMSNGYKATTSPDAWSVVDGKLYLNYNQDVRSEWLPKNEQLIVKADSNWSTIRYKPM